MDEQRIDRPCKLTHHSVGIEARFPPQEGLDAYENGSGEVVVNCLDKEECCYTLDCQFCTDGGNWPLTADDLDAFENMTSGSGI